MAIIKGNYTKSRAKIKATIRYITHRPGREGERATRALFSVDGEIDRRRAYQMIDQAERGTAFFRIVISPDPKREDKRRDLHLKTITRQTILRLGQRLNRKLAFIAAEHNDHTEVRHVHAIVLVKLGRGERLGIKDYQALREAATATALLQRQALDLRRGYQQEQHYNRPSLGVSREQVRRKRQYSIRLKAPHLTCPDCGYLQVMYTFKSGISWCPACRLKLNQHREAQ